MAFLQYKTEAIPGKTLKRKVTQEETRERKKQYEKDVQVILEYSIILHPKCQ
jgi:hypothetical protein